MPRKIKKINENKKSRAYNEFKEENKKIKNSENNNNKENYIIAEINIDKNNLNKDIRIINSYEEVKRKIC